MGTDSIRGCLYERRNVYCGVLCGGMLVSSVLFADDTVLLAESEEDMRRSRSVYNLNFRGDKLGEECFDAHEK